MLGKAKKLLVTTPIFYINAKPHIGHAYTLIYSDYIRRLAEFQGKKAYLSTGIDEHGKKVFISSQKEGLPIMDYCDKYSDIFKNTVNKFDIKIDVFQRTTDPVHLDNVKLFWEEFRRKGLLQKLAYKGLYNTKEEEFVNPRDVNDSM